MRRPLDPQRDTASPPTAVLDGRSTRWKEHRASRRAELVEATLRAIRKHGAAVHMDQIAAQAGTSKTVIYRHFEDKAGLYLAVADRVDQLILHNLAAALRGDGRAQASRGGDRGLITSAIDAYLTLVEADPEVYRFVVTRPLVDRPMVQDPVGGITARAADQVAAVLESALTDAAVERRLARVWAVALVGMVQAAADDWLKHEEPVTRAALVADLSTLAWQGLEPALRPASTAPPRARHRHDR